MKTVTFGFLLLCLVSSAVADNERKAPSQLDFEKKPAGEGQLTPPPAAPPVRREPARLKINAPIPDQPVRKFIRRAAAQYLPPCPFDLQQEFFSMDEYLERLPAILNRGGNYEVVSEGTIARSECLMATSASTN